MKLRLILEGNILKNMYHGGDLSYNKPIYFNDTKIIAQSYGDVTGPFQLKLGKSVTIDFSKADGWWLPEEIAEKEVQKLNLQLDDFDLYRGHTKFKSVKTDHFVKAAIDNGYDSIVFKDIMDAGSLPVKGNKWIRSTDVVILKPNSSNIKLMT